MVVVVFRSRLGAEAGTDYSDMASEMVARAKTMPGFLESKWRTSSGGEPSTARPSMGRPPHRPNRARVRPRASRFPPC